MLHRVPAPGETPLKTERGARVLVLPALVLGAVMACEGSCCEDPVLLPEDAGVPQPSCDLDTDCGAANQDYRFGECRLSGCESDADCCPGTRCRLDVNACVPLQLDPEYACETDGDCQDSAMRCQEVTLGGREPVLACAYDRCQGDSDCGAGRSCYQSVCVQTAPCGGACPEGTACEVLTGQCAPVSEASRGCSQACGEAGLLVFTDPDTMSGERCCALQCQCRGLPPLLPTRYGRYARVAATPTQVLVSAYEADFGDLVVARYKTDGSFSRVQFVDGMPPSGAVVADPNGPRGGVAEPGPDVGTHTSIALDAEGAARIAYHDVDNRSLKVAIEAEGSFAVHTVDIPAGEGTLGTFTDIAVEPASGRIHVTYLAHDVTGAPGIGGTATGVKLARSRVPQPASASDWEVRWVDARPSFDPCGGACSTAQACVLGDDGATCLPTSTACSPACSASTACVEDGAAPTCLASARAPSLQEYPRGRGLHSAVALDGSETLIAYYDSIDGEVRFARVDGGGSVTTAVIDGDGQDGRRAGDVGRFPAIARVGGELLVVYEDFARHEVRAWRGAVPGSDGTFTIVDNGKVGGDPGKRFVGAGLRVAVDAAGEPLVVYQDASNLDLKLARFTGASWQAERILDDGAHGFYGDIAVEGDSAFVVSVLAELDARGRERSRAALTVRALP